MDEIISVVFTVSFGDCAWVQLTLNTLSVGTPSRQFQSGQPAGFSLEDLAWQVQFMSDKLS